MTMPTRYKISVSTDWPATRARWLSCAEPTTASPFQSMAWLDAWYASFTDDIEPVLVEVCADGVLALRLALIIRRIAGQRVLQFADLGVTDFNAPVLGPAAPTSIIEANALWQNIADALPDVDLVDFRKMPPSIDGRPNPLALVTGSSPCPLSGHRITFGNDWDAYHFGLEKHARKEIERSWRVFQKTPDAQFVRLRDVASAQRVIDFLDRQQRARLEDIGDAFHLDRPGEAQFYRHDLAARLASGEVIVTALMSGDEIVAALYGIAQPTSTVFLRIANAGSAWSKVSPGRLIVHRTLHHLHETGVREVDLSIGDYDYKRRMGPVATPLTDLILALSWKGRASAVRHRAVTVMRRYPAIDLPMRRLFGRRDPATGKSVG